MKGLLQKQTGMFSMIFREIKPSDNYALADLIRVNLKAYKLDIPGTAYFDEHLDRLSEFYLADRSERFYYILEDEGKLAGGIGLAKIDLFEECAELQKLYLSDDVKGKGLGYKLISLIEDKARELGYKRIYLETHDNLKAAVHLYERCDYTEIDKPESVVHSTMNRFFIKDLI